MQEVIRKMLDSETPKINMLEEEKAKYRVGLGLLGLFIKEDFFDIQRLVSIIDSKDGLYYSIPYYDNELLYSSGNTKDLLVIYRNEGKSSFCPLRISCEIIDRQNYSITLHNQMGDKFRNRKIVECINSELFTEIPNFKEYKLSELID